MKSCHAIFFTYQRFYTTFSFLQQGSLSRGVVGGGDRFSLCEKWPLYSLYGWRSLVYVEKWLPVINLWNYIIVRIYFLDSDNSVLGGVNLINWAISSFYKLADYQSQTLYSNCRLKEHFYCFEVVKFILIFNLKKTQEHGRNCSCLKQKRYHLLLRSKTEVKGLVLCFLNVNKYV